MRAIANGIVYHVVDDDGEKVYLETANGESVAISFSEATLILDPTDQQLDAAAAGDPPTFAPELAAALAQLRLAYESGAPTIGLLPGQRR